MDVNSKINISESGHGDHRTATTTNLRSGQPATTSPNNNTLPTFSNPLHAPIQGKTTSDQPLAASVDKGVMQLQSSSLQSPSHDRGELSERLLLAGTDALNLSAAAAGAAVPLFALADQAQAQRLGLVQNIHGLLKSDAQAQLPEGSSSVDPDHERMRPASKNYQKSHEISIAKRMMMQKLGGRASTSEAGQRNPTRFRVTANGPDTFKAGLAGSASMSRGLFGQTLGGHTQFQQGSALASASSSLAP